MSKSWLNLLLLQQKIFFSPPDYYLSIHTTVRSWWSQWGFMMFVTAIHVEGDRLIFHLWYSWCMTMVTLFLLYSGKSWVLPSPSCMLTSWVHLWEVDGSCESFLDLFHLCWISSSCWLAGNIETYCGVSKQWRAIRSFHQTVGGKSAGLSTSFNLLLSTEWSLQPSLRSTKAFWLEPQLITKDLLLTCSEVRFFDDLSPLA